MTSMLRAEKIDEQMTDGHFPITRPEWDDLLSRASKPSIFVTWEWLVSWWEIYQKEHKLWWLTVRDAQGRLVGSAPLYLRRYRNGLFLPYRELRFIGTGEPVSPEHLDLVADRAYQSEVVSAITSYLVERVSDWDVLQLTDLSIREDGSALTALDFDRALGDRGVACFTEDQVPGAPSVPLPDSWEEYFRSLSQSMRTQITRHRRKVSQDLGLKFHVWSKVDGDLEFALDEFERLFRDRKTSIGISDKFKEVWGYREFHRRLAGEFADRGWLYLAFLIDGKKAVAAQYAFLFRGTLYAYQSGFDSSLGKFNVSKVLRSYVIQDVISRGVRELDFLRGEEAYKYDWNALTRRKQLIRCFSPTFYGHLLTKMLRLKRAAKWFQSLAQEGEFLNEA